MENKCGIEKSGKCNPKDWLDKELKGYIGVSMSERGAEWIKEVCKRHDYNKKQCKEVIMDALWYSDEDFSKLHLKKIY